MDVPTIETERLRLRAFTTVDWESYAEMYSDELCVRYLCGKPLLVSHLVRECDNDQERHHVVVPIPM